VYDAWNWSFLTFWWLLRGGMNRTNVEDEGSRKVFLSWKEDRDINDRCLEDIGEF
jgi:hypothetical protein